MRWRWPTSSPARRRRSTSSRRCATEVVAGLEQAGLDDLVAQVDTNLFGLSLDTRVPAELHPALARMLIIGLPAAVFIAPAG